MKTRTITFALAITLICVSISISTNTQAQRLLPQSKALQISTTVPKHTQHAAQSYNINYQIYRTNANYLAFGINYTSKNYHYRKTPIPTHQITAEATYFKHLLSDPSKTLLFNLGTSLIAGYESINKGNQHLPEGATLLNPSQPIYGGAITLEANIYITDHLAITAQSKQIIYGNSTLGTFHHQLQAGLKYIF